jgi:hypothetical protein
MAATTSRVHVEITQEIVNRLRVRLDARDRAQLAKRPTSSVEAYRLFIKAMYHPNKWTAEGLQKGIEFLRQAIEMDPAYPNAYSGLAYIYLMLGSWELRRHEKPPQERNQRHSRRWRLKSIIPLPICCWEWLPYRSTGIGMKPKNDCELRLS